MDQLLESENGTKDSCIATYFDVEKAFDSNDHDLILYWILERSIR